MRSARTATDPAGVAITLWPPRKRAMNSVAGFSNRLVRRGACSMRPLFMTTTRSASARASSCPWVTWMKGMLSCLWKRRSSARIRTRKKGSSADSGSSSRRICGSVTSARASATRCCWPPDSCAGTRSAYCAHGHELEELHRLLAPRRLIDALHPEREGDVVDAGEMREERVALEHHRRAALGRRQVGDVGRADENVAFGRALVARNHAQRRGLAAA